MRIFIHTLLFGTKGTPTGVAPPPSNGVPTYFFLGF